MPVRRRTMQEITVAVTAPADSSTRQALRGPPHRAVNRRDVADWPVATNFSLGPDVSFRGEAEVGGRQSSLPRSIMTHSGQLAANLL